MSNYTKEKLIHIPPTAVPAGTLAIKVGNEIFTPGNIKIGSGSSMAFYKCTEVFGPKTVNFVTASDAGTADCVGKYVDTGTKKNGESIYKYESTSGTIWYIYFLSVDYEGDYWVLSDSLNVDYPYGAHYYGSSLSGNWDMGEQAEGTVTITKGAEVVNADQPETWSGRKAVFDGEKYVLEESITANIPYDRIVPVIGKYYTYDCLISSDYMYTGYPEISCPVEPDANTFGDWVMSASSVFDSPRQPYKAFTAAMSNSYEDGWHSKGENPCWIQWQNTREPVLIAEYSVTFRSDTIPTKIELQGSQDGVDWHTIDTVDNPDLLSTISRVIDNAEGYFYHRLYLHKDSIIMIYKITAKS